LTFHPKVLIERAKWPKGRSRNGDAVNLKNKEKAMELYVPKFQLKEVLEVLAGEGVASEVTGKTFFQVVEGKEQFEVAEVKANLLETEVPAIYDEDSLRNLRAFRLPSGKQILLTDTDGNFVRLVEPPGGWER
jgi:hypothetical protein